MRKLALHWQILIAIVLAVIVGTVVKSNTTDTFAPNIFGVPFVPIFDYVGTMFLNALKMLIVPLIVSSIIVGVAGIDEEVQFIDGSEQRLGLETRAAGQPVLIPSGRGARPCFYSWRYPSSVCSY